MSTSNEIPYSGLATRFRVVEAYSGGEGWSGLVRSVDDDDSAPQVLKVLDAGIEPREVSLLASLAHPAIPHVVGVGESDGHWFLLREFVEGEVLTSMLPLEPAAVSELAQSLLRTLSFVHLRGVLHLDIKPSNVIRRADGDYSLLDFGLASRIGESALGGSMLYAAPERLLGAAADERSDLYAVGVLCYCALGGSIPKINPGEFRRRVLQHGFFAAVGTAPEAMPPPFDRFLPGLLALNPAHRTFPDAQEALEALAGEGRPSVADLHPDPIEAHRPTVHRIRDSLAKGSSVRLTDGDDATRLALAFHAVAEASTLGHQPKITRSDDAVSVSIEGGSEAVDVELGELSITAIASHLEHALNVPTTHATRCAEFLHAGGARSVAALGTRLEQFTQTRQIVPDGPRWVWPDAIAGRTLTDVEAVDPPDDAAGLRAAASSGHTRLALRAYSRLARDADTATETSLRQALVEGLLLGGEPARALPLTSPHSVLHARALFDLGRIDEAAAQLPAQQSGDARLDRYRLRAMVALVRGDAQSSLEQMRDVVRQSPTALNRVTLGQALLATNDDRAALDWFRDLERELRDSDDRFLVAATLTGLGECQRRVREFDEARRSLERARDLLRSLGHIRHAATATTTLGTIAKDAGDFATALQLHREARALFEHVGDERGAALARANLGNTSLEMGDFRGAADRLRDAFVRFEQLGMGQHRSLVALRRARALAGLGDRDAARNELALARRLGLPPRLACEASELDTSLATDSAPDERATEPRSGDNEPMVDSNGSVPKEAFRTFLAINRRLAVEVDLARAMDYLVDAAVTMTGGRMGYLLVSRDDALRKEFHSGDARGDALAFSRSMANRAVQTQRSMTADDVVEDRDLRDMPSVQNLQNRSALCVPFRSADGHAGAIYVEHPGRPDAFGPDERAHLEVIADQAAIAIDRMMREEALTSELETSRRELASIRRTQGPPVRMLGESEPMQALRAQIEKIAASDLSVLIHGETGTGKELVARAVHDASDRRKGPFVPLNCCAIPEQLMESELFGHTKGAFTGADSDHQGLLEVAAGGTLFLDEIGDMPLSLQIKLLRALQEKTIRRVGGVDSIPIDTRIVSATHKDLSQLVESGEFRQDLFFRIVAAELVVPPLRSRGSDIELLANAFLDELNTQHGRDVKWSDTARRGLARYPWPGNVRELQHVISRAFLLTDGDRIVDLMLPEVEAAPTPDGATAPSRWPAMSLREAEERTIDAALAAADGEKTKAAKILGISRTALYEKLKRMKNRADSGRTPEP